MIKDPKVKEEGGRKMRGDSLLGLLLVLVLAVLWQYCGGGADDSKAQSSPVAEAPAKEAAHTPDAEPSAEPAQVAQTAPDNVVSAADIPATGEPVCFLMQNVENYFVEGERTRSQYVSRPKPVYAREAVADVIAAQKPAIVGLVEVGGPVSLKDLLARLKKRGLEYPYYRVLVREGEERALAVISRFPIVQDRSVANYPLYGEQRRMMLRGILDVVVKAPDGRLFRILGAHLKSHVADDSAAADSLRQREAITLSMYLQKIAREQPNIPTLIYGDWNDGPGTPAIRQMEQGVSKDAAMTRLDPKDSRGQCWTIYYKGGHEYCTYDQIFVNKTLKSRMRKAKSGVVDIPAAKKASDHRAVWCQLF